MMPKSNQGEPAKKEIIPKIFKRLFSARSRLMPKYRFYKNGKTRFHPSARYCSNQKQFCCAPFIPAAERPRTEIKADKRGPPRFYILLPKAGQ